ncbi:MAG: TraB/GumN family protein [Alphaproteobacteria bacterium]|nr:TraB/GumN family protein [Alphaproteobacteria bacterium]
MRPRAIAFVVAALVLSWFAQTAGTSAWADKAPQRHLLWKVTGPKGGIVYLYGTVHVGKADFYPLPRIVEDSFKRADALVEEVDVRDTDAAARAKRWMVEHRRYAADDATANHLSADTRAHLGAFLRKSGKEESAFERIQPWLIAVMVLDADVKRQGFDPAYGLDKHFLTEAADFNKPVKGLETIESQLMLFGSMSDELQDKLLLSSLVEAEKPTTSLLTIIDAWQRGDVDKLQSLNDRTIAEYPQLKPVMKPLIDDRNDAMTAKIEAYLDTPQSYFVAVGAAHLIGERGIVRQLQDKRFAVQRL